MVNESLGREENVAELALHRYGVLEHALVNLQIVHFLRKVAIPVLDVGDRFREVLVRSQRIVQFSC